MKKTQILPFKGEKCKLVQYPNFILNGIVEDVFDDCLKFSTDEAISIIDFKAIKEIHVKR